MHVEQFTGEYRIKCGKLLLFRIFKEVAGTRYTPGAQKKGPEESYTKTLAFSRNPDLRVVPDAWGEKFNYDKTFPPIIIPKQSKAQSGLREWLGGKIQTLFHK